MSTATPAEVHMRMLRTAMGGDIAAQADLYAPDGVLEFPFLTGDLPRRFEGRENIRAVLAALAAQIGGGRAVLDEAKSTITVHETTDPELIVVELEAHATLADGTTARLPYVHVLRVRDGRIVSLRDYFGGYTVETVTKALAAL